MQVFYPSFTYNNIKHPKEYRTISPYFDKQKKKKSKSVKKQQSITIDLNINRNHKNRNKRQKLCRNSIGIYNSVGVPKKTVTSTKIKNFFNAIHTYSEKSEKVQEQSPKNNFYPIKLRLSNSIRNALKNQKPKDSKYNNIFSNSFQVSKKPRHTQCERPRTQKMLRYTPSNVKSHIKHVKHVSQAIGQYNYTDYRPWSPSRQERQNQQVQDF